MPSDREKKARLGTLIRRAAIVLFLLLFVLSAGLFLRELYLSNKEDAANQQLRLQLREIEAALPESPAPTETPAPVEDSSAPVQQQTMLPQYESLWLQNSDMAGWLRIPDTPIDYPVMHTPDDPERYLHRAFDGSYAYSGSLFMDAACTPYSAHALIYGHHMKNKTMFGSLSNYASADFAAEHPVIYFDTLYEQGAYQVLAAFYSRIYSAEDGEDAFRYYQYADLSDPARFEDYVRQAKAASLYDTGVEAQVGDRLLTLSTCSSHTENGRFVVIACQKAPQDP